MESRHNSRWDDLANKVADDLGLAADDEIPTPADVANALSEVQPWIQAAKEECEQKIAAAYKDVEPPAGAMPFQTNGGPPRAAIVGPMMGSSKGKHGTPTNIVALIYDAKITSHQNTDGETTYRIGNLIATLPDVETILALDKNLLAPLIKAWFSQPEQIRPDAERNGQPRKNGIIPKGLFNGHPIMIPAQLRLDDPGDILPLLGRVEPDDHLPLFAELIDEGDIPVAPLLLADAAGFRGLQPGRGARLDKRLLIYSLLEVPRDQRRPGGRYELRKELREIRGFIFPDRERIVGGRKTKVSSYRPSKHAQPLHSALQAINLAEIVMPDGYHWRPVIVRGYPSFDDLDSEVIIQIELPSGSDHGPAVNKPSLIEAGTISDPAFDLELGLAYLWDEAKARNGGRRIYATRPEVLRNSHGNIVDATRKVIMERGRPATRWNHPKAIRTGCQERNPQADKVRILTREDRRRLAYGIPGQKKRPQLANERKMVDRLLNNHESAGRIVIERNAVDGRTGKKGWRILEGLPAT